MFISHQIESEIQFLKVREHLVWIGSHYQLIGVELGELVPGEVELT